MMMSVKRVNVASGVSLIEVMVATAILVFGTIGALSYEYHVTRDARIAGAQIAATRTAQLLLEDWMSTGGSDAYDPSALKLGFSSALDIPTDFGQGQADGLGTPLRDAIYAITVDDVPMLVMLAWKDVAHDTTAEVKLRQVAIIVEFGTVSEETMTDCLEGMRPVILTTYVRVDAAGG
jgi:type II secretory pathway pseudopilin PulG